MGMGWHVALNGAVAAAGAIKVDGKALIHRQHDLDEIAQQLGLRRLTEFVSVDPRAVAGFLQQQGLDPDDYPIPEEEWFASADGLATVQGLLAHLRANPDAVFDAYRIVRDLTAIAQVLSAAATAGVEFHLVSDMPS
ncbi:hypothetical protein AYO44_12975 [Planctomycetaceae bacterium SCGC AG-212-F19]|nr:hypothetical protein AYO44_12975 [Planctomycetaceae bacterium SCGC AG-212-F19]